MRPSAEFSLSIVIAIILLLLDKANKLRGVTAVALLIAMAGLLAHATTGMSYIRAMPTRSVRARRFAVALVVIIGVVTGFGVWIWPTLAPSTPAASASQARALTSSATSPESPTATLDDTSSTARSEITSTPKTSEIKQTSPMPILDVSAEQLMVSLAGRTTAQANVLSASYIGRPIEVSGVLSNVSVHEGGTGAIISLDLGGRVSREVFARFQKPLEGAEFMLPGDLVSAVGLVESVDQYHIILDDSRLLSWSHPKSTRRDK